MQIVANLKAQEATQCEHNQQDMRELTNDELTDVGGARYIAMETDTGHSCNYKAVWVY